MNLAQFTADAPGHFTKTIEGQSAFVPNDLPPQVDKEALFKPFGNSMAALGMLNAKIGQLANPGLIIGPLQRQEALASSAMEGTFTTSDELALYDAGVEQAARPETIEVHNYAMALAQTTEALERLPISHRLIRNAHSELLANLPNQRGGNKRPGEYKTDQNWIGGRTIQSARFVPPPPKEAGAAMDALELFLNREHPDDIPALIEAAIVHYQFETIHPFADGNGRVGRILIPVLLLARQAMSTPVFYPSVVLEDRKDQYIDLMFNVSAKGAWTDWIHFFLNTCTETCRVSGQLIDKIVDLQTTYRSQLMESTRSNNPLILLDHLFAMPVISAPMATKILNVTHRAARLTIGSLEEAGVVEKLPGLSMPEFFVARGILGVTA
ncbi:MAG: Fic family protein [Pseudomonadota bacterium]